MGLEQAATTLPEVIQKRWSFLLDENALGHLGHCPLQSASSRI